MNGSVIAVAQDREEINYIINKFKNNQELTWLPVNLDTLIYLKLSGKKFINPSKYLDNNLHKKGLIGSEKLSKKFKFEKKTHKFLINRFIGIQRKHFNSSFFLFEVLENFNRLNKIKNIVVSGFINYNFKIPSHNYFITQILKNSHFKNRLIILKKQKLIKQETLNFKILDFNKIKNEYILISNLGYNFKRIFFALWKKRIKIITFSQEYLPWYKYIIYRFLGLQIIKIKTSLFKKKIEIKIPDIKFYYKGKNYSKIISARKTQILTELQELKNLSEEIDINIIKNKPKIVLLNLLRGINGYLSEISNNLDVPCFHISHGTLAYSKNNYSYLYNKIISEELTTKKNNQFCIQSKIAKQFANKYRKKSINHVTGNLIFNYTKSSAKKNILYAVTNRDFNGMHFYGIEMFYEYFKNLEYLNYLAKSLVDQKIIVKPHPTEFKNINNLKRIFTNLIFTDEKNSSLFKKVNILISFSSSIIEDSLNSNVPVILFDQWNRYNHCDQAEKDFLKKNSALYYINNKSNLIKCIQTINDSNKFNFEKFVYKSKGNNFKKIFEKYNIK